MGGPAQGCVLAWLFGWERAPSPCSRPAATLHMWLEEGSAHGCSEQAAQAPAQHPSTPAPTLLPSFPAASWRRREPGHREAGHPPAGAADADLSRHSQRRAGELACAFGQRGPTGQQHVLAARVEAGAGAGARRAACLPRLTIGCAAAAVPFCCAGVHAAARGEPVHHPARWAASGRQGSTAFWSTAGVASGSKAAYSRPACRAVAAGQSQVW